MAGGGRDVVGIAKTGSGKTLATGRKDVPVLRGFSMVIPWVKEHELTREKTLW